VKCTAKVVQGESDTAPVRLEFSVDTTDPRNHEWSTDAMYLILKATVRIDIADQYNYGEAYTLTIE
jgi:hypothetical protein